MVMSSPFWETVRQWFLSLMSLSGRIGIDWGTNCEPRMNTDKNEGAKGRRDEETNARLVLPFPVAACLSIRVHLCSSVVELLRPPSPHGRRSGSRGRRSPVSLCSRRALVLDWPWLPTAGGIRDGLAQGIRHCLAALQFRDHTIQFTPIVGVCFAAEDRLEINRCRRPPPLVRVQT